MLMSLVRVCVVYVVKEVVSFRGARSINGCGKYKNTRSSCRQAGRLGKNVKLHVVYSSEYV